MIRAGDKQKHFTQYKISQAILAPLFKLCEAILELLIPYFMIELIGAFATMPVTDNLYAVLIKLFADPYLQLIVLATLLSVCFSVSAQYMAGRFATDYSASLKEKTYLHALALDNLNRQNLGAAYLNSRVITDCMAVQNGINLALRLLLRSPFVVVGAIIMTLLISPLCGALLAAAIVIIACVTCLLLRKSLKSYADMQEKSQALFQQINEAKSGQACIRAFNAQSRIIDKFSAANDKLASYQKKFTMLNSYIAPCSQSLINCALLACLLLLASGFETQATTASVLIAVYSYFNKSLLELIKLADLLVNLSKSLGSYMRIKSFLALEAPEKEAVLRDLSTDALVNSGTTRLTALKLRPTDVLTLKINSLSYTYPQNKHATLKDLNPGLLCEQERYGVLGLTAGGKSTLAKILSGLYPCPGIEIKVNGKQLTFPSQAAQGEFLRANSAFVEQEPKLLQDTLRANFRYADLHDDYLYSHEAEQAMWKALEQAEACDFVRDKGGLDCEVTAAAANFSGGQRSRLALAIALFKQPKILILDDFLQALDLETSLNLMKTLDNLTFSTVLVCLSQRVATLLGSDKIFVLDDHRLRAAGSHEFLLAASPLYRQLFETQYPAEIFE